MGTVFKAKHKFLKSLHAVKIISPEVVREDETLLVRFRQEAILAASIHHPNVVAVTDFGVESEDTPYLVMEFIEGISLDDFLRSERRLSPVKAFEMIAPIARGVGEAHSKGITHRDLKPLNVMISRHCPPEHSIKVLDFGLAKIKSTESFASLVQAKTTKMLGSPHYMSPEQWANEGVDTRSDIYSLGIMLFQMLTGEVPFKGESIPTIMYQHLMVPAPPFETFGISVSPQIETVVRKALAKEQNERYSTVEEFLTEYESALSDNGCRALPITSDKTVRLLEENLPHTQESNKRTGLDFNDTYNFTYLNSDENKSVYSYLNFNTQTNLNEGEQLAQKFLYAQSRVEEARSKISEAEKLAQEFNEAQLAAENARRKVMQARQKLEEDVRRQIRAEMESKLAAEREARQKAEAEAHRLLEEANARMEAENRANELAKTALAAQQRAEAEHQKAEKEIQQRQFEESTRRKAEEAALKLAEEVAEARRKYEEAKREAENEAYFRMEAEVKRKKIEEEIVRIAQFEAEKRKAAEAQAAQLIKEQASRLEKQAIDAQSKAAEARRLAESEMQKREQADSARIKAEDEARRLAKEIIEAQKQLQEAQQLALFESEKRALEETARKKAEESIRSFSAEKPGSADREEVHSSIGSGAENKYPSLPNQKTSFNLVDLSLQPRLINTSSSDAAGTTRIHINKYFQPLFLITVFFVLATFGSTAIFLVYHFSSASSDDANISSKAENGNTAAAPAKILPERVSKKMVFVSGGTFRMGRNDVKPDEIDYGIQFPANFVTVESFYIDRTEVSNQEYADFVNTGHQPPPGWQNGKPPAGKEKLPVTNVSYIDAAKFAEWVTKRDKVLCQLPSEKEWEYAARSGKQENIYPWGNQPVIGRANINSSSPTEVGTTEDETSDGTIKDMLGNVMEWTSTIFDYYPNYPESKKSNNFESNKHITIRGVSYEATPNQRKNHHLLITYRQGLESNQKYPYLGFRLVCHP